MDARMKVGRYVQVGSAADQRYVLRVDGGPVVGERIITQEGTTLTVSRVVWSGRAKDGQMAAQVECAEWGRDSAKKPSGSCINCGAPTDDIECGGCR